MDITSRWRIVTISSRPLYKETSGIISVITIAKPPNTAPATKYGGKIVVCQPGNCDTAKSNDTIECTDNTSGVERPAKSR